MEPKVPTVIAAQGDSTEGVSATVPEPDGLPDERPNALPTGGTRGPIDSLLHEGIVGVVSARDLAFHGPLLSTSEYYENLPD
jgi:hypothetical protein